MQLYLGEQAMTCHLFDHWSLAQTITITVTEKTDNRYNVCHNSDIYLHHYIIVEIIVCRVAVIYPGEIGCITSQDNIPEEIVAILLSLDIVGVMLQIRDSDSSLASASSLTAGGGTNGTHHIVSFRGIETTKIALSLNRNEPTIPFPTSCMPADFMTGANSGTAKYMLLTQHSMYGECWCWNHLMFN